MAEIKNYEVCLTDAQLQTLAENGEITIGQETIKADEIEFVNTKKTITAEIPVPPTTDGTYNLQAVVSSGTITYQWVIVS